MKTLYKAEVSYVTTNVTDFFVSVEFIYVSAKTVEQAIKKIKKKAKKDVNIDVLEAVTRKSVPDTIWIG